MASLLLRRMRAFRLTRRSSRPPNGSSAERIREALAGSLTQQGGGGTGAGVGSTDGGLMLPQPSAIAHALLSSACEAASILAAVEK